MFIYVGVDIGLDGALAALTEDGKLIGASRMPLADDKRLRKQVYGPAMASWLMSIGEPEQLRGCLEYVHSFGWESRSSMFSFGRSDGKTRATFEMLGIPFTDVDPRVWKRFLLEGTKKDKLAAIEYCKSRWGDVAAQCGMKTLTDGVADAFCIAEYARMNWSKANGS